MSRTISRRRLLRGAGAGAALALAPAARAQTSAPVRWAYLSPGFTALVARFIDAGSFQTPVDLKLAKPTEYSTVSTYYNDFAAGNYDVCMGSWDTFASRYQAGVPIRFLCTITTADMILIATGQKSVTKIEDLRGKTLAAGQSTGTYRMVSALIKERYNLELGKDIAVQGVDNPAAAMTLVMADRSDAGLSWEPNISAALRRRPDLRTILNAGQAYRELTGSELPYFGVAVRADWAAANAETVRRLRDTFSACLAQIERKPDEAASIGASATGFKPDVIAEALTSRRLEFRFGSMTDPAERATVVKAGDFLVRNGLLTRKIDDGFFVAT